MPKILAPNLALHRERRRQQLMNARTVEESVYIHQDFHRRGIGRAILSDLLAQAKNLGHHRVIAAISGDQDPSLALHRALGFVEVGHLTEVGFKFGKWLDLVYLEYRI